MTVSSTLDRNVFFILLSFYVSKSVGNVSANRTQSNLLELLRCSLTSQILCKGTPFLFYRTYTDSCFSYHDYGSCVYAHCNCGTLCNFAAKIRRLWQTNTLFWSIAWMCTTRHSDWTHCIRWNLSDFWLRLGIAQASLALHSART